jgi:ribosomal protein S28E/S33
LGLLSDLAAAGGRAAASSLQTSAALLGAGSRLQRRALAELDAALLGPALRLHRRLGDELRSALRGALADASDALWARLLSEEVVEGVLSRVQESGITERVVDRVLSDGTAEQVAARALAGPELERMLAAAFEGPLVEEAVAQLLESEAIWILVDEIARSPSVTEAISHQGSGFVDEMAQRLRDRSRRADTRMQELAARVRHVRADEPGRVAFAARTRAGRRGSRPSQ